MEDWVQGVPLPLAPPQGPMLLTSWGLLRPLQSQLKGGGSWASTFQASHLPTRWGQAAS